MRSNTQPESSRLSLGFRKRIPFDTYHAFGHDPALAQIRINVTTRLASLNHNTREAQKLCLSGPRTFDMDKYIFFFICSLFTNNWIYMLTFRKERGT